MAEARCDCCDLPLMSCGKEIEETNRRIDQKYAFIGMTTTAKFESQCSGCRGAIRIGDVITCNVDHGWLCDVCADA